MSTDVLATPPYPGIAAIVDGSEAVAHTYDELIDVTAAIGAHVASIAQP